MDAFDAREGRSARIVALLLAVLIAAWLAAYVYFAIRAGLARP